MKIEIMFTGKAKDKLEEWLIDHELEFDILHDENLPFDKYFFNLHPSMQWGIVQDFAESLKIVVCVDDDAHRVGYYYDIDETEKSIERHVSEIYNTRQEARNEAIRKLNELINNKLNQIESGEYDAAYQVQKEKHQEQLSDNSDLEEMQLSVQLQAEKDKIKRFINWIEKENSSRPLNKINTSLVEVKARTILLK